MLMVKLDFDLTTAQRTSHTHSTVLNVQQSRPA